MHQLTIYQYTLTNMPTYQHLLSNIITLIFKDIMKTNKLLRIFDPNLRQPKRNLYV